MRIDKYLWAVRLYKKRNDASTACTKGWILINKQSAKPSKTVKEGDIISVKQQSIYREYKVLNLIKNRVGAKLVAENLLEITPEERLFKLKVQNEFSKISTPQRDRQTGRPTKKERRDLDKHYKS